MEYKESIRNAIGQKKECHGVNRREEGEMLCGGEKGMERKCVEHRCDGSEWIRTQVYEDWSTTLKRDRIG